MPPGSGTDPALPQTAHPQQIGLLDFAAYALVVDARSEARFAEDHIPGAVSVPVSSRDVHAAMPGRLTGLIKALQSGDAVLLYAQSSERVLDRWADQLRGRGLTVDVLSGGWRNYRRWVESGLESLPRMFAFRLALVPEGVDARPVVDALVQSGEQVLDLASAGRPGTHSSRAGFETWLLDALRHRETDRRLWVIEPADRGGNDALPAAMEEAFCRAPCATLAGDLTGQIAISHEVERLLASSGDHSRP